MEALHRRQLLDDMIKQTLDEWMHICEGLPAEQDSAWRLVAGVGYLKLVSVHLRRLTFYTRRAGEEKMVKRNLYHSAQYRSHAILLNIGIAGDHNICLLSLDELLIVRRNIRGRSD